MSSSSSASSAEHKRTVVTVSGVIPENLEEQVRSGRRPRADYVVLAEKLDAELLDYAIAQRSLGRLGPVLARLLGNNVVLTLALLRRAGSVHAIFTDGEQVGLPYAALSRLRRKRPAHHMIVHIMSVPKKSKLFRALRLGPLIDTYFVYSSRQGEVLRDLGVEPQQIVLTSFMVDTDFFSPRESTPDATATSTAGEAMICSAGLEFRDYETFVEAVRGLDVQVQVAAASPWSKRSTTITESVLPDNVTTCRLDLFQLRDLYGDAAFVVMPLVDVEFQAGVTTILEAMAMGKAVICSQTPGQTDVLQDGKTGLYVPPGDVDALRAAIVRLLEDPELATDLGAAARQWVVEHADVERYAARLADRMLSV